MCAGKIYNCLQIMNQYYLDPSNTFYVKEFTDPWYSGMENTYCIQFDRNNPFSYVCAIRIGGFISVPVFNHLGSYNNSKSFFDQVPEYCDWYDYYNFNNFKSSFIEN